ncbi:WD40 repeat-like protein [Gloeophyllum trabeum ATCC 11539]|uniref:WD40 repeat-like protein n=1 Tax=Gloeophyllum trabeum (strain ATCC 11539 / FP-39264 / Madison 617) TaxID=670483 RepID=S7QJW0_GLOTA|nr:WD40 repeat-like protein [Gloeophyllum trabeum ATCC 11539]EPQ59493.1 WD40 repeat-like protein [Gloeophyllum trabeum ATCC 11539]
MENDDGSSAQRSQFIRPTASIPLPQLKAELPYASRSERWKRVNLSHALYETWDRVQVLGDEDSGHTGCVNALSWVQGGDVLLSGGDDRTVRFWRMDPTDSSQDYPFICTAVIKTGHRGNIFNNQMLPFSSRIATVSGDSQVRVFDITNATGHATSRGPETEYNTHEACICVLRCHRGATKRIVTEESPDTFLTVSEDGTVRQHDLRHPHVCGSDSCPPPLIKVPHDLYSIGVSPLTPYQFVVAGESPYGYLFDRRQVGRSLQEEAGVPDDGEDLARCVRRFARKPTREQRKRRREYISGVRMAQNNGHEVLMTYGGDAVYLFSTLDNPGTNDAWVGKRTGRSVLSPNPKRTRLNEVRRETTDTSDDWDLDSDVEMPEDPLQQIDSPQPAQEEAVAESNGEDEEGDDDDDDDDDDEEELDVHGDVPIIYPQRRFAGHCNVETIKDVNFLGPDDDFVVSGSDDGNFFVWTKSMGKLHGIYEGDGSVVNVVEAHPQLPLVAVSGIDTTVKLFAPVHGESRWSRFQNAEAIVQHNMDASHSSRSHLRVNLGQLLLHYNLALREEGGGAEEAGEPTCTFQ